MKQNQSYTAEFRTEAVRMVLEQGLSQAEVAARLGVPKGSLANWVVKAKGPSKPFSGVAEASREDLRVALDAVRARDLPRLGEVVESNALGMHATMIASRPSVLYWLPETLDVVHTLRIMRDEGFPVWATIDAGPNVKVLTTGEDADQVAAVLRDRIPCATTSVRYPGGGVRVEEVTA